LISFSDHGWRRLAVVGALVAALGLSACGRTGPRDAPPYAGAPDNLQAAPAVTASPGAAVDNQGRPRSPGSDRTFILDGLID
jgi:predicted small lipoprotein YifL